MRRFLRLRDRTTLYSNMPHNFNTFTWNMNTGLLCRCIKFSRSTAETCRLCYTHNYDCHLSVFVFFYSWNPVKWQTVTRKLASNFGFNFEKEKRLLALRKGFQSLSWWRHDRGELSYLALPGSENISAPYFKQCFFRGGYYLPRLSQTPRLPVPRQK